MLPDELAGQIREDCGDVLLLDPARGWAILTDSGQLQLVCRQLKNIGFIRALNMTANHLGGPDFHLYLTLRHGRRHDVSLTLKWKFTLLEGNAPAADRGGEDTEAAPAYAGQSVHPSLSLIWRATELMEREIFEFFGIPFAGNPNLIGLILDPQLQGFPLRREFRAASHENYAENVLKQRADAAMREVLDDAQL
ncbi:MAG: NADH-quinone oxidoreductase subunit C [Planctomycetales bacterium]|nr:NADH-quinone oxidoreductase subunit C [bacterium]UNM09590.1 MAG: NADH-quinone oxidoreductase subunit C [Planctomycetales bacterium]